MAVYNVQKLSLTVNNATALSTAINVCLTTSQQMITHANNAAFLSMDVRPVKVKLPAKNVLVVRSSKMANAKIVAVQVGLPFLFVFVLAFLLL